MRNLGIAALLFMAFAAYSAATDRASAQVACPTPTPTVIAPTATPLIPTATPTRTPSPQPTATPSGYAFQDEFTTLDTAKWAVLDRVGDASNNERECYKPAQAFIDTGNLIIESKADASCAAGGYSSAMLQWRTFSLLYGRIDVRAVNDSPGGQWPAIWLLGTDCQAGNIINANPGGACQWPQPGSDEIDIAEWLGGNMATVNEQIHTSTSNFGCTPTTTTSAGNWHVYSIDWRPGVLKWLIDGVVRCTLTGSQVPSSLMFLIINQAVGGAGGTVNPAAFPAYMGVDYVRVSP